MQHSPLADYIQHLTLVPTIMIQILTLISSQPFRTYSSSHPSTYPASSSNKLYPSPTRSKPYPTPTARQPRAIATSSRTYSTSAASLPRTTISRRRRQTRDVGKNVSELPGPNDFAQLLDFNPLGNLAPLLSKVDLSNITVPVPVIPVPQDPPKLPVLPGLREHVEDARKRTIQALGGGSDLRNAVQQATETAIHSMDPVSALSSLSNNILQIFHNVAKKCPVRRVGAAVLQDGLIIVGNIINSVRDAAKVRDMLD